MSLFVGSQTFSGSVRAERFDIGVSSKTLTGTEQLTRTVMGWLRFEAAQLQYVVLPDATTLDAGWSTTVEASGASSLIIQAFDSVSPTNIQTIESGKAYQFVLKDNSTAGGGWHIILLHGAETTSSARYVHTFTIDSWGVPSGGFYSLVIPASLHGRGTTPLFQVNRKLAGQVYEHTFVESPQTDCATGDITLLIPASTSDNRFDGMIVII